MDEFLTSEDLGASIKAAYEAEADTNAYTDAEKTKLASLDAANYATAAQGTDERVPTVAGLKSKFGTAKASLVDGDKIPLLDSEATDAPKHGLWSLIKLTLKTYFDTLYALAGHTHGQLHDRSHAITSTSDHTAGNWKVFHSNGTGQLVEVALGADGTYLKSNGASAAPTFATPAGGSAITIPSVAWVNSSGNDTTGTIGNPALPYLTAQAAWDDGARVFEIGAGSYTITHSSASDGSNEEIVTVKGITEEATSLTINWNGNDGTEESPAGKTPYKLRLYSDHSIAVSLDLAGGDAHSGDNNGGSSPIFELYHVRLTGLGATAGSGSGSGSSGNTTTGSAWWCEIPDGVSAFFSNYYATLENNQFKGGVSASNVDYAPGTETAGVGLALDNLAARAITEHYMTSSDFTDSTGAVGDVSGLACSVAANERIAIEIVGLHAGNATGSGLRIAFTGPASPTHLRYGLEHYSTTTATRAVAPASSFGTDLVEPSGTNDVLPFRVFLSLTNGANAGTVQFRAGSEINTTSITLTRGVLMRVHRLP
jgi:hypothetical protein